ncbi:putative cytochrome p450 [Lyophyllum shimeji]|uniref:Cytochrome p450 n=1 Tax=Lyophyllum shimeji TaxID=47721 RepID=A0A9P3PCK6_LYOSH|nr:putative cytochrome p450 [Lyophyllum shimeji]
MTPGIAYLATSLPTLLPPLIAVYVLTRLLHAYLAIHLPPWAVAIASIFSIPVALLVKVYYKELIDRRRAAAQGAVLPPRIYDKWPAGIGLLLQFTENLKNGYPGENFEEWSKTYGNTFNLRILFENRFFTAEPDYIKAILATQFDIFEKGPVFDLQTRSFLGTGVFNSDGEMWKFHRAMTRPFFSKDRITEFDIFERHAQDAIQKLKARLNEGYPVDIQDLVSRFTMDSATEFLFAKDVRSLDVELPYPHYSPLSKAPASVNHPANIFSKAFDEAQRAIAFRSRFGAAWPLTEFFSDKVKDKMGPIYDFINPILAEAVARKKETNSVEKIGAYGDREVQDGECLIDHLINYTDDPIVLRDETLNILLAGRDTTTNSISYAIYMLAKHPPVLNRLRDEILRTIGSSGRPTYDNMKNMKYLRAVINETLRLYPAVPFNVRTSNKATLLPSKIGGKPFYIPANSKVPYSVFLMQRRTDLWGPDANEFDPDRFLDDRLRRYLTPNPFIFLPFNAGPRICLGQQFAYHETSYFLIRLLQTFSKITTAPEAQPPDSLPPQSWANAPGTKGTP